MIKLFGLLALLLLCNFGFSQKSNKSQPRQKIWIYDVEIIKDQTGKTVKIVKNVFCKGTPGGPVQIRYFETKARFDGAGNIIYSTRERLGDNNVDPEIIKQYGT